MRNKVFVRRNAIYKVDPTLIKRPDDAKDKSQTKDIPSALQKLFSLMEFSNKSYVNPEVFTGQLSINVLEQQDSHEFQTKKRRREAAAATGGGGGGRA